MPRAPRILIEGGLYHVYNRFARGEEVFADPEEAVAFLDLLRELKERDDLQVLAWCLLSNHYHLAVRTSAVPLSRTMRTLQGGFAKAFNRRWKRSGPLWRSRYQARLVDNQRYFEQLIFYIHLNPVRAGLVEDPIGYVFCGHRELLGKVNDPLLDVDDALLSFGSTTKSARRSYLKRLNAALAEENCMGAGYGVTEFLEIHAGCFDGGSDSPASLIIASSRASYRLEKPTSSRRCLIPSRAR